MPRANGGGGSVDDARRAVRGFPSVAIAVAATLAPAATLFGEEPEPKPGIEEIIVTAQKREANLQDVPISMTALGGEDVSFRDIRGLQDLQYDVPGLTYGEREGGASATVRGVGLNVNFGPFEGGVATHIDGQYQPVITSGVIGLNDLERVEVLRGPQGTLYGRNATGGAINFILKKPTDDFEATARLGYSSFDTKDVFAVASGPIIKRLLDARIYGEYDDTQGFIDNLTLDRKVGGREGYGGRAALRFLPLDNVTADLSVVTRKDHLAPVEVMVTPPDPTLEAELSIFPPSNSSNYVLWRDHKDEVKEQRHGLGHKETTNVTTTIGWDTPLATVKSITAAQYHYLDFDYDNDAENRSTFHLKPHRDRSVAVSQEVNVSHSLDLWWKTRLDWLAGAFYFSQRYDVLIDVDIDTSIVPGGIAVFTRSSESDAAYAGFADATLWLTSWLRLFGGVRQSFEDKDVLQNLQAVAGPNRTLVPPFGPLADVIDQTVHVRLCQGLRLSTSFDNLSPRYGAQVDATDSIMLYAQRALGFKAGGANPFACNNIFNPEDVDSKEVGVKSRWFDDLLVANVAFFTNDYTNFQILETTGLEGPVVNAPSASIRGMEIELHSRPFGRLSRPLSPLLVDAAVSLLHARYDDFSNTDPANPNAGSQNLTGNHMNRAPDYTVTIGTEYPWRIPLRAFGTLRARSEWFVTDDIYFREFGRADDRQNAYWLWNVFLSATNRSDNVELRFFGRNVLDKRYLINISATQIGTHYGEAAPPASFGSELTVRF
jgi:iron complex outermembrane recepter protein